MTFARNLAGFRVAPVTLALLAALLTCGCGARLPTTAAVRGRVTWGGQPVPTGSVVFYPAGGRPATGIIESDGTFELTTFKPGDGALLGLHRVTIEAFTSRDKTPVVLPKTAEEELSGVGLPFADNEPIWLVPAEFAELNTTSLTAEVTAGENEINFDLPAAR